MISKEVISKNQSRITEEDRRVQRMLYYALVNNDVDEFRDAFQYFYNLYHDKLYALALMKVDVREYAEDVVLDSFVEIHKRMLSEHTILNLKSYLYRIFLNSCMEYNLKNKNYKNEYYLSSSLDEFVDIDDFIQTLELNDLIDRLLKPIEKYILIHYIIREESLLVIKDKLNLKSIDIYKMYKKILAKLKKGVSEIYDR